MSTLLDTILMLSRDGFQVSFATEGKEHVVILFRDPISEEKPCVDVHEYIKEDNPTEERVVKALLSLAVKSNLPNT